MPFRNLETGAKENLKSAPWNKAALPCPACWKASLVREEWFLVCSLWVFKTSYCFITLNVNGDINLKCRLLIIGIT